jgi:hypothetical protein
MRHFFGRVRRLLRFCLACALWLHAFFVFRVPSPNLSGLGPRLHLTTGETFVFVLLFVFSLLAAYGFGRLLVDVLYLYGFPFVLLWIAIKWTFKGLVAINRFCMAGTSLDTSGLAIPTVKIVDATQTTVVPVEEKGAFNWKDLGRAVLGPFRRFTLLWCFLLVSTTHQPLLEIALTIVVIHVVFILTAILRVTLFSAGVIANLEGRISQHTDSLLAKIASVNRETEATPDLRNIWTNLSGIKTGLLFLQNKQLVSRWAAVLGCMFLGCVYIYVALLFSFIYYGAARVQSLPLTWPMSFVTSLFLPFSFTDLPHNFWIKLAGGLQCVVMLAIGAGTVINYMTRKAQDLQETAMVLSQRFADEDVQARLVILEEKFKATPQTPPQSAP